MTIYFILYTTVTVELFSTPKHFESTSKIMQSISSLKPLFTNKYFIFFSILFLISSNSQSEKKYDDIIYKLLRNLIINSNARVKELYKCDISFLKNNNKKMLDTFLMGFIESSIDVGFYGKNKQNVVYLYGLQTKKIYECLQGIKPENVNGYTNQVAFGSLLYSAKYIKDHIEKLEKKFLYEGPFFNYKTGHFDEQESWSESYIRNGLKAICDLIEDTQKEVKKIMPQADFSDFNWLTDSQYCKEMQDLSFDAQVYGEFNRINYPLTLYAIRGDDIKDIFDIREIAKAEGRLKTVTSLEIILPPFHEITRTSTKTSSSSDNGTLTLPDSKIQNILKQAKERNEPMTGKGSCGFCMQNYPNIVLACSHLTCYSCFESRMNVQKKTSCATCGIHFNADATKVLYNNTAPD